MERAIPSKGGENTAHDRNAVLSSQDSACFFDLRKEQWQSCSLKSQGSFPPHRQPCWHIFLDYLPFYTHTSVSSHSFSAAAWTAPQRPLWVLKGPKAPALASPVPPTLITLQICIFQATFTFTHTQTRMGSQGHLTATLGKFTCTACLWGSASTVLREPRRVYRFRGPFSSTPRERKVSASHPSLLSSPPSHSYLALQQRRVSRCPNPSVHSHIQGVGCGFPTRVDLPAFKAVAWTSATWTTEGVSSPWIRPPHRVLLPLTSLLCLLPFLPPAIFQEFLWLGNLSTACLPTPISGSHIILGIHTASPPPSPRTGEFLQVGTALSMFWNF